MYFKRGWSTAIFQTRLDKAVFKARLDVDVLKTRLNKIERRLQSPTKKTHTQNDRFYEIRNIR